ncbi:MAG: hypothetical protein HYX34_01915 [Actinobacteria bacterium]|nr:hypothetical protein [Actinomycetota bacterium]
MPYPQPSYGQARPGQPSYGQPSYGQPSYGQPPSGWPTGAAGQIGRPPAARPEVAKGSPLGGILAVLGGLLGVVSPFLAWIRVRGATQTGMDNGTVDAKVVLAVGIAAIVLGIAAAAGARSTIVRLLVAAVGVAFVVYAIVDISSVGDLPDRVSPRPGAGLFVLPLAGALCLLAAALIRRPKQPAALGV